jgi:translation initiation factor 2B subunit (eIF-2B alpha/beta/delta family)/8-oxo-dGTP pyrophosphatase MutT (NUDIX family)
MASNIHRVVSTFLLRKRQHSHPSIINNTDVEVALFHRCSTMPTFPSHWAAISGTIEPNELPWEAAQREVAEETNLTSSISLQQGGLYVDVLLEAGKIIRVYPFVAMLSSSSSSIELCGTEHDTFQFIPITQLRTLQPTVPCLYEAFHHATFGRYLSNDELCQDIRLWSTDTVSGAATLAKRALRLAEQYPQHAHWIPILRPTMVPIINAINSLLNTKSSATDSTTILQSMEYEMERCVQHAVRTLLHLAEQKEKKKKKEDNEEKIYKVEKIPFTIATFSRSSTIQAIINHFRKRQPINSSLEISILCGKSTPGDEGILMASDIQGTCIEDSVLYERISEGLEVDCVIVGADCILPDNVVINKIGTKALSDAATLGNVPIFCFSDRWKIWSDIFPPPLEQEIFELVPYDSFTRVLVPEEEEEDRGYC